MSKWEAVLLKDVVLGKGEYGINASACDFNPDLFTYLRISDISEDGRFLTSYKKSVNHPDAHKFLLKEGDITFARTGNSTGKTYLYNPKDGTLVFAGFLIKFSPDSNKIDSHYLKYITQKSEYKNWVSIYSARTGQPGINEKEYGQFRFDLPPLPHQRKIARILTTIDNVIETTESAIVKYKAIKQGMMHDLFTRGIDIKTDKLRPTKEEAPHLYKKTELGWIPKEWKKNTFDDVTLKISDRDHFTPFYINFGVPIISPKDFGENDLICFKNCKHITLEAHKKNRLKTDLVIDDLVFTRIGAKLGKICIVEEWMPEFSILHSACMIRVNPKNILPHFLMFFIKSSFLQKQIAIEVQSIGVPDLGLDKINEFKVFYPSNLFEQKLISKRLNLISQKIETEQKQLSKLQKLKQGLMQDLLTGKKEVKPDEEDYKEMEG